MDTPSWHEAGLQTPLLVFGAGGEDGADKPLYAVYPRRYWLLFLLSLASCQQSTVWMTWSPAVDQVRRVPPRLRCSA